MPFVSTVSRALSFSIILGTALMAHFRRLYDDQVRPPILPDRCSNDPTDDGSTCFDDCDSVVYPLLWEKTANEPMDVTLLKRVWELMGGFSTPWSAPPDLETMSQVDVLFEKFMDEFRAIAKSVGLPPQLPESFHAKLPFRRSGNIQMKSLTEDMELLTFYSKSNAFLNLVASDPKTTDFLKTAIDRLENAAVKVLTYSQDTRLSPKTLAEFSSDIDLLHCLDAPAAQDLTPLPQGRPKDRLLRFGFCQNQLALFLANLSTIPESVSMLSISCLNRWLELWSESQDIRLRLLSTKIRSNVYSHQYWHSIEPSETRLRRPSDSDYDLNALSDDDEEENSKISGKQHRLIFDDQPTNGNKAPLTSEQLDPPVILGPDVYKLDLRSADADPPKVDIIFINGMLGSVFHTWRQHDNTSNEQSEGIPLAERVRCWPREWLSREFPEARILGVNANLKPFLWNPICPSERVKRRIDQRARGILQQLLAAGVGRRPIIWISHSAGGILTKEVLKVSCRYLNGYSSDCSTENVEEPPISGPSNSKSSNNQPSPPIENYSEVETEEEPSENSRCFSSNFKRPFKSMPKLPSFLPSSFRGNAKKTSSYQAIRTPSPTDSEAPEESDKIDDLDDLNQVSWVSHCGIQSPGASVANKTCGILFISVPHRGNQSMFFLYQFPMVFALTPEAKQLNNNYAGIKTLHEWFVNWAKGRDVPIVNMLENRDTIINRWYHTRIVPYDAQDLEFSKVVLLDRDHAEVCKPKSKTDEVYTTIADFVRERIAGL